MKVLLCLAALLLLAAAIPPPNTPENPLRGRQITDPNVLAELQARHERTLAKMKDGDKVFVHVDELADYMQDPLRKRQFPFVVFGIAGLAAVIEAAGAGADIAGELVHNLLKVFLSDDHAILGQQGPLPRVFPDT
jgi:hypothetical protein